MKKFFVIVLAFILDLFLIIILKYLFDIVAILAIVYIFGQWLGKANATEVIIFVENHSGSAAFLIYFFGTTFFFNNTFGRKILRFNCKYTVVERLLKSLGTRAKK